ncbi:hypothetical protein [Janthinobacterium rivuli]|uniref:hypothetical protein n=1 Tax=Janthinobacterium rivuli TaxID=2751478 RepID=UPI00383ACC8D
MTKLINVASHAVSKSLVKDGKSIKRSHIQEVLAAILGYQTYAALSVEENDDSLAYHLDDAEMLVLNPPAGARRAHALDVAAPGLIEACIAALQNVAPVRVYEDLDQFYDDYAREELVDTITNSDDVSAAMSETNAYFDSEANLPYETPATDDLWAARSEWCIEASGDIKGGHDTESDRMFAGDTLNCRGKLTFDKAGRAGLIFLESEGSAGVDESWREQDFEYDEAQEADLGIPEF